MFMFDPPPFGGDITLVANSTLVTGSGLLWGDGTQLQAGPATTDGSGNTKTATLAVNGATIGANAFAFTGSANFGGGTITTTNTFSGNFALAAAGAGLNNGAARLFSMSSIGNIGFAATDTGNAATNDANLSRGGAANIQLGYAAVDTAPVAQTLSVQNVLAGGTSNVAGANFTIAGSQGKGTGAGGDVAIQIAPAGSTGTAVNALADALRVKGAGSVLVGIASVATNATDGFIYIAANAGTPTGTPTTRTGYIPAYIDTTNSQLWLYMSGAWKQPKTPAGAATVTWQ